MLSNTQPDLQIHIPIPIRLTDTDINMAYRILTSVLVKVSVLVQH